MLVFLEAALTASTRRADRDRVGMGGQQRRLRMLSARFLQGTRAPEMSLGVLGWSIEAALLVALISSVLPLRRITKMNLAAVLAGKSSMLETDPRRLRHWAGQLAAAGESPRLLL